MRLKSVLLIALVCLAGACALDPKRGEPPVARVIVQPAQPSEADQLLAYISQMRKLGALRIAAEREQMRTVLRTDKTDFNCVKMAVLLTLSPLLSPAPAPSAASLQASDDAELMALLKPLLLYSDTPNPDTPLDTTQAARDDIRSMATLLYSMAQERTRWRDQWREAQARMNALRRDDSKELEVRTLRAHVEELERKLAALKSIDRSVNRRTDVQRSESRRVETPK